MTQWIVEIHLGVPRSLSEDQFRKLQELLHDVKVLSVHASRPGSSSHREYEGHGVDGELGLIYTIRTSPQLAGPEYARLLQASLLAPGSRVEVEILKPLQAGWNIPSLRTRLQASIEQCEPERFQIVPAPKFELHIAVDGMEREPSELITTLSQQLQGIDYFEVTVSDVPETVKGIVTVAGSELPRLHNQANLVHARLRTHGEFPRTHDDEQIISAVRPLHI